jgi:hypothetical protein
LTADVSIVGDWRGVPEGAALQVCTYVRNVCVSGFDLISDRQPARIRIEDKTAGWPAVWLHKDNPDCAKVLLNTGAAAWAQLAYQLGHELGHVLCNSWQWDAKPGGPSQWVEESLAESFSIANLAALAQAWQKSPPFAGNQAFGRAIADYRNGLVADLERASAPTAQIAAWLRSERGRPEAFADGSRKWNEGLILLLVQEFDKNRADAAELGAVNRWNQRAGLPFQDYVKAWQASCAELGRMGILPQLIGRLMAPPGEGGAVGTHR